MLTVTAIYFGLESFANKQSACFKYDVVTEQPFFKFIFESALGEKPHPTSLLKSKSSLSSPHYNLKSLELRNC